MSRIVANALRTGLLATALISFAGCTKPPAPAQKGKLPEVMVSLPVEKEVLDNEEFTGRTDAKRNVTVRARVELSLRLLHL
jgi:hypothetical protein